MKTPASQETAISVEAKTEFPEPISPTVNRTTEAPEEIVEDSAEAVHHSDGLATNISRLQREEQERLDEERRKEVERLQQKARLD